MSADATDEALMLAFQAGDARAFEQLYARYRGTLYRFLVRQCGNAADGEELYQDVWLTLARQRARWEPRATLKTFLYRIAHSRLLDHYRRHRRHGRHGGFLDLADVDESVLEDSCPAVRAEAAWEQAALQAAWRHCLDALPPPQREAFLLREEGGLELAQLAEVAGIAIEAAKSRLRYAVNRLRQCLGARA
ncbi:MAG: sigma-70 family RNA polymerase sigma factor [Gammaproteobacteria bacterium]